MEHVHFTLKNSEQSLLCVLREGNHTGAYSTDIRFKIVTEDAQTTGMATRWKTISCREYGTWYRLFIRPREEPLVNDISQVEVMEHSLSVILYYIAVQFVFLWPCHRKHGTTDREKACTYCHMQ